MIELERHIEILLLSNDCVIVPGLGGFMAHHIDARYDEADGLFLPPLRTLGFNPQLQLNDHLLVQSYIEAYDISYPESLRRIEEETHELKQHLENEGSYELNDIGILRLNDEGHLTFEPCEAGILTPEYYGLNSFEMQPVDSQSRLVPLQATKETTQDEQAQSVNMDTPVTSPATAHEEKAIVINMSWLRNAAAVAAAIVAFFIIGTPVSNSDSTANVQQSSMLPSVTIADNNHHAQAPAKEQVATEIATTERQEQASATVPSHEAHIAKEENRFTIVMASQTTLNHAEDFIERLGKKGFKKARIMSMNQTSKVRVVYDSFADTEAAHQALRLMKQQDEAFREAWVLEIK